MYYFLISKYNSSTNKAFEDKFSLLFILLSIPVIIFINAFESRSCNYQFKLDRLIIGIPKENWEYYERWAIVYCKNILIIITKKNKFISFGYIF